MSQTTTIEAAREYCKLAVTHKRCVVIDYTTRFRPWGTNLPPVRVPNGTVMAAYRGTDAHGDEYITVGWGSDDEQHVIWLRGQRCVLLPATSSYQLTGEPRLASTDLLVRYDKNDLGDGYHATSVTRVSYSTQYNC